MSDLKNIVPIDTIDTKYKKEKYSNESLAFMKRHSSLWHIFLGYLIMTSPIIILFLFICLFAILLPGTSRYGIYNPPATFSEYFYRILKVDLSAILFFAFLSAFTAFIDFVKAKIDIYYGYKLTGCFLVKGISNRGSFKSIKLNNNHRIKIKSSNQNFALIKEGQIIEIEKTVTHQLISCRILKD